MAWESRVGTKNKYFTRSRREGGRVVREYFGNGPKARQAARESDRIRELREQERIRQAEVTTRLAAAEQACELHYQFVEMVLHAVMEENGYHYHRGEWRKRRVPSQVEPQSPSAARRRRPMPRRPVLDCRRGLVRDLRVRNRKPRSSSKRDSNRDAPKRQVEESTKPDVRLGASACRRTVSRRKSKHIRYGRKARPPPTSSGEEVE